MDRGRPSTDSGRSTYLPSTEPAAQMASRTARSTPSSRSSNAAGKSARRRRLERGAAPVRHRRDERVVAGPERAVHAQRAEVLAGR